MRNLEKQLIIGGEWIYYKIYTGSKTLDLVLKEIIKPITQRLIEKKIVDKWFFIRYGDPESHLRIRIKFNKQEHLGIIIQSFFTPFSIYIDEGLIWRVQVDTYLREIKRYGYNSMTDSESLFFYDSQMIVEFLEMIEGDEGEELRWLFCIRGINQFLEDFDFSLQNKIQLLKAMKDDFGVEFNINRELKTQITNKYREHRNKISDFMNLSIKNKNDFSPLLELLSTRSDKSKSSINNILNLYNNKKLDVNFEPLIISFIHMHINRIFKSKNNIYELVLYNFLYNYYKMLLHKKN